MAICSNCGSIQTRVKSRWNEKGERLLDECPSCSPDSFGRITDPSDTKIWMGYEVHPNQYEKRYDHDGAIYLRKPEYRAEQEEQLRKPATDEQEATERAIEKKRRDRRQLAMSDSEMRAAIAKARMISEALKEAAEEGREIAN